MLEEEKGKKLTKEQRNSHERVIMLSEKLIFWVFKKILLFIKELTNGVKGNLEKENMKNSHSVGVNHCECRQYFSRSEIYSLGRYLSTAEYVCKTILGTGGIAVSMSGEVCDFMKLTFLGDRCGFGDRGRK